jgi:hypothetical protein
VSKALSIEIFLRRLRQILADGRVVFQPRSETKTRTFMLEEGLTAADVLSVLGDLEQEHSVQGPEGDRDGSPGTVMVFSFPYVGKMVYIKLKIWTDGGQDFGSVMSFHEEGKV